MGKTVRILSMDGGGISGVIPAVMLHEVEKVTGTTDLGRPAGRPNTAEEN